MSHPHFSAILAVSDRFCAPNAVWQAQGLSPHVHPAPLHPVSHFISRTVSVSNESFKLIGSVSYRDVNVDFLSMSVLKPLSVLTDLATSILGLKILAYESLSY